jgi:precorrin-2/cobalt-factor-2 C20-methyltransferase
MTSLDDIAGRAASGTLYGIGVGPGDARYMTLRAAALVRSVDVLAYFAKKGRQGNAREIVSVLVGPDRRELKFVYPVTDEIPADHPDYQEQISGFYRETAAAIEQELTGGRSVGLLAEGDPFFYGSFMHMWRRLDDRFPVEVVPGVTGMSGCWTRANAPITWGDDVLTVLPGTLSEEILGARLAASDAAVIMKIGGNLSKVRRAVEAAGMMDRAIYVERGTMTDERILPLSECNGVDGTYFAMVIIPGQGRRL